MHEESINRFFGLANAAKIITPIKCLPDESNSKGNESKGFRPIKVDHKKITNSQVSVMFF